MIKKMDVTTKCSWTYWMVNRWALVRFDWLGSFTVVVVMIIVVTVGGHSAPMTPQEVTIFGRVFGQALHKESFPGFNSEDPSHRASGGFEGLSIIIAMTFTWSVYWACRFISQLELDLK
jgi:hypothetical protein